ncbi:hypothetical protein BH10PSE18_BH10PSE18_07940 [soil metagenome]
MDRLEYPNPKELEPVWADEGKFNRVRDVYGCFLESHHVL